MHRTLATTVTVGTAALFGVPAPAQSGFPRLNINALRTILPVEARYASAIQARGLKGFERETAPGFTLHHGHDHWTGAAASAQVYMWLDGIQGGRVAVTIRRVSITGKTAVVVTRERLTFPPGRVDGRLVATAAGTWYWKQTWRHTPQGWKLSALEPVSENALGPAPPVEYTVTADGGSVRTDVSSPDPRTT